MRSSGSLAVLNAFAEITSKGETAVSRPCYSPPGKRHLRVCFAPELLSDADARRLASPLVRPAPLRCGAGSTNFRWSRLSKGIESMSDLLFCGRSLSDLIRAYPQLMRDEVDKWEENKILAASETDLIDYLVEKYILNGPKLRPREEWNVVSEDTKVDVSHDFRRGGYRDGRRLFVAGQRITVHVPFEGDADLFSMQPASYTLNPPRAHVSKRESALTFSLTVPHDDSDAKRIQGQINNEVASVERCLEWVRNDCEAWNGDLRRMAKDCIRVRKRRLLEQASLLEQLGIPLKRHPDSPSNVSIPFTRRKRPKARVPATPAQSFQPEPTIAEKDYGFILDIISRLATSIERSPSTFARLPEEHIRDHLLVSLNSHFDGGATGETFNSHGKTAREERECVYRRVQVLVRPIWVA